MKTITLLSKNTEMHKIAGRYFLGYHHKIILSRKLFAPSLLAGILLFYSSLAMSQANTELSNLIAPTKVNVNLQPTSDNSKNLGSDTKSWKDFYLDGYLYLDGARFISNAGGLNNVFVGNLAGNTTMTGAYNSALGDNTLTGNTTGNYNSAFGNNALNDNTTGDYNSAFGRNSLSLNTVGDENSAFGYTALTSNTTGYSNSAFGAEALKWNSTGVQNSAFGNAALYENNTGSYNAAFGSVALYDNISGDHNSAFGNGALTFNTTGDYNSAFGDEAITANTTGSENAAFGRQALSNNSIGIKNAAVGNQAGIGNTTGNYNAFFGYDAGGSNSTGSQNTYIGYSTEGTSSYTNVVGIGYQLTNTASNQARIGNSSTTSVGGWANWSNVSDGRFKINVKENVSGLAFINKLRPVTYNLDVHAADAFVGKEFSGDHETGEAVKISEQAKSEKEKIVYSGFIAQEVETAANEIGYDFSGVDAPKNENDFYGLRYAEFVVPLVKAVQELTVINDVKDEQIKDLQNKNAALQLRIENIERQLGITNGTYINSLDQSTARLEQNIPNPAKNTTTIGFYIPANTGEAMLMITDGHGRIVNQFNDLRMQQTHVEVSTLQLLPSVYSYSLYVDGKAVDTKQMVITR
ncbi:MAG TPA: tail fiber domain-containing protein [Chitinophagales bacterium]|nr:tail fiber domain-containing protein [Chitinophagales bacterium]